MLSAVRDRAIVEVGVVFCTKCGRELADGARFCSYCGAQQAAGIEQSQGQQGTAFSEPRSSNINSPASPAPKAAGKGKVVVAIAAIAVVAAVAVAGFMTNGFGLLAPKAASAPTIIEVVGKDRAEVDKLLADYHSVEKDGATLYFSSEDFARKWQQDVSSARHADTQSWCLRIKDEYKSGTVEEADLALALRNEATSQEYAERIRDAVGASEVMVGKYTGTNGWGYSGYALVGDLAAGVSEAWTTFKTDYDWQSQKNRIESGVAGIGYNYVDVYTARGSKAGEADGSASGSAAPEAPSFDVETADFAFNIPPHWKDKVEWTVQEKDGRPMVLVYPKTALGYVEGSYLASVESVDPSSPNNAGDYITHKLSTLEEGGKRVDIYTKNWPAYYAEFFYKNPTYGGSSQENELMAALIDLSSGGQISLADTKDASQGASNAAEASSRFAMVEAEYITAQFVPLVQVRTDTPASSAEGQRRIDYEARAQAAALALFTNAESNGASGMKWVGSDFESFVAPSSEASRSEQISMLANRSIMLVAKTAKITENDGERHQYAFEVVYEANLNEDGTNVQANIARVKFWLNDEGMVERLEIQR